MVNVTSLSFTPKPPQRFLQQRLGGSLLRGVDLPREGALAAHPSRHAAKGEQGRGRGRDRAGEHVHLADQPQVVRASGSVQPVFEDQVHEEDGIGGAGRVLPDELNEETVVVRGQNPVLVGACRG